MQVRSISHFVSLWHCYEGKKSVFIVLKLFRLRSAHHCNCIDSGTLFYQIFGRNIKETMRVVLSAILSDNPDAGNAAVDLLEDLLSSPQREEHVLRYCARAIFSKRMFIPP